MVAVQIRMVSDSRTAYLTLLDCPPIGTMITRHLVAEAERADDDRPWEITKVDVRGVDHVTGNKAARTWWRDVALPRTGAGLADAPEWVREFADYAINGDPARAAAPGMAPAGAEAELAEAWAALPDSVAGNAAPEGTTLAQRIDALAMTARASHDGHGRCHARHRAAEDAMAKAAELLRGHLGALGARPHTSPEGDDHG